MLSLTCKFEERTIFFIYFFLKEEIYYGKPRYMCFTFIKTEVECTLVESEGTAVVVVTCCPGPSRRHVSCQLSIFSVFLKVLLLFLSAHG